MVVSCTFLSEAKKLALLHFRICVRAGLPDDLFSNQKSQFEKKFEGLRLDNVEIFYGQ
jgi:hypothetical protein